MQRGHTNANGQLVMTEGHWLTAGLDEKIYSLSCTLCGFHYGESEANIATRKCPACQGAKPGTPIPTLLLTFKEKNWDTHEEAVVRTAAGERQRTFFRIRAYHQAKPGHRAFVLKQGVDEQGKDASGLLAAGYLVSGPHPQPLNELKDAKIVQRFEVEFDSAVSLGQRIPRNALRGVLSKDELNVPASGHYILPPSTAAQLEKLWCAHIAKLGETRSVRISFDELLVGEQYDRKGLAALWGYADWHAISRGCVTPAHHKFLILFITHQKQEALTQYSDYFEGDALHMEGETSHANDQRIKNARTAGDEIHLFYRDTHQSPFTYVGLVSLIQHELKTDAPSLFVFETDRAAALAQSAIRTESRAYGADETELAIDDEPEAEGLQRLSTHPRYERSAKNRALAIKLHGNKCMACDFDFNSVYGSDLARDFIQVHHTRSITELNGSAPNIEIGLVPLCANCHSMAHREPGRIVPIAEIQDRIQKNRRSICFGPNSSNQ